MLRHYYKKSNQMTFLYIKWKSTKTCIIISGRDTRSSVVKSWVTFIKGLSTIHGWISDILKTILIGGKKSRLFYYKTLADRNIKVLLLRTIWINIWTKRILLKGHSFNSVSRSGTSFIIRLTTWHLSILFMVVFNNHCIMAQTVVRNKSK